MANKKRRVQKSKKRAFDFDEEAQISNIRAFQDGPKRKNWSPHDIRSIRPITQKQTDMFQLYGQGSQVVAYGCAGTGKTFVACYLAINDVLDKSFSHDKVIIVRSVVPTREVGHLPGTLDEKIAMYELPYIDIFHDLVGRASTYGDMKEAGIIQFMSSSFIRGLTWNDAIVIVDEFQNMSMHELDGIITRVGENTRLILCGDIKSQCDLKREKSAGDDFIKVAEHMHEFSVVEFTKDDIVRSEFVKSWIEAREELDI